MPVSSQKTQSAIRGKDYVDNKINKIKFSNTKKDEPNLQYLTQDEIKQLKDLLSRINGFSPPALRKGGLMDNAGRVIKFYEISVEDFFSRKRHKNLVNARRDFCHLVSKKTQFTCGQIGRFMKRDHTSVLYHLKHPPVNLDKIDAA